MGFPQDFESIAEFLNPQVLTAQFHHAEAGWKSNLRTRTQAHFDFWFIESGRGRVRVDGNWIPFQKNDMVLMKPGQVYEREETEPDSSYDMHYFFFDPFGSRNPGLEQRLSSLLPTRISFRTHSQLGSLFAELFEMYAVQPPGFQLRLKACTLNILGIVFENLQTADSYRELPSYPRVQAAREFITEHYREELPLRRIASVAGLSPSYLSSLFRTYLGVAPIEFQIDLRLQKAKLLLAQGISVSNAADQVGFHSIHYFSRLFKKCEGVGPMEFTRRFKRWPLTQETRPLPAPKRQEPR